jgi:hypothetical protein
MKSGILYLTSTSDEKSGILHSHSIVAGGFDVMSWTTRCRSFEHLIQFSNSRTRMRVLSRGARRPGCACIFRPKRAWGTPDAQCTRGLVCNCSGRTHTSNNEYTGITRRSRTQWFYGLFRFSGLTLCLKPGWADTISANLTPASGRQDHTTSPYAATSLVRVLSIAHKSFDLPCNPVARKTLPRPPHPASRLRRSRAAPLSEAGQLESIKLFLPNGEAIYFSIWG